MNQLFHAKQNRERGFIAIISILIMSTVLLATTLSLAQFGIASRFFILNLEQKAVSEKLAEGCVHVARVKVYNDPTYSVTDETISIGDASCTLSEVDPDESSGKTTISAKGVSGDAVTNLRVVVDADNGDFESWTELETL